MAKTTDLSITDFVKHLSLSSPPAGLSLHEWTVRELSAFNRENLRKLITELSAAYNHGVINDEELSELITHVCSMFIENEVEDRFRRFLVGKIPLFYLAAM